MADNNPFFFNPFMNNPFFSGNPFMNGTAKNTTTTNSNPFVEQTQNMYKQWADQAQQYANQAKNAYQQYVNQAQDAYKQWTDQAQQYADQAKAAFQPYADQAQNMYKQWTDQVQQYAGQAQNMFQPYADQFQNAFKSWADMSQNAYQQMSKMFNPNGEGLMNPMDMYKAMLNNYQEWSSRMTAMMPGLESFTNIYKNFLPDTTIFNQFVDLWKGLENPQEYMKNFAENYASFMNNFFKASPVFGNFQMFSDPQRIIDTCIDFYRSVMQPWMDIDPELSSRALNGDTTAYLDFFKSINEKYDDSFGKLFNMQGFGLNREANADYMHAADNFYKLMYSGAELFTMIQNKVKEAGQKLVEKYQETVKAGQNITTLRGFYDLWYNVNEDALLELFNTDEYAKVFAAFSNQYAKYTIAMNKVYERMLAFLPIPTDTDMRALYKTVYDLRKDVRDLKRAAAQDTNTKKKA